MRMDTAVTQEIDYARLDELKRDSHRYETEDGGTPDGVLTFCQS